MKFLRRLIAKIRKEPLYLVSILLNLIYLAIAIYISPIIFKSFQRYINEPKEKRAIRKQQEHELLKAFRQIKADRKREEYEKKQKERHERNKKD